MNKTRVLIFAIILALVSQLAPISAHAESATDILCEKIESDYYYELTQEMEAKIERIKANAANEETAISEIVKCLDKHSTYYTKEYCESLIQTEKKSAHSFQTIDSAYIKIDIFDLFCESKFEELMTSISSNKKDLYIDLTDCGGGFISSMLKIAEWLIPEGIVCTAKFKKHEDVYKTKTDDKYDPGRNVHIIVSRNTASAAEILAGAIKMYGSGTVIGTEATYGKTSIQELVYLPTGGVLKITVGEYLIGTDYNIAQTGLNPEMLIQQSN